MNIVICISMAIIAIIIFSICLMSKKEHFQDGKSFLNENSVIDVSKVKDANVCIEKCKNNKQCGGITFNKLSKTCYLNNPGNHLAEGLPNDQAWVKK